MRCAQPQASGTGSTRYMAGMVAATLIQKVVWRRHTSKNISHFWHVDRNTFNHKSRRITRLLTLKYRKIIERPGTPLTALPRPLAGDEGAGRNFCGRTPPPQKKLHPRKHSRRLRWLFAAVAIPIQFCFRRYCLKPRLQHMNSAELPLANCHLQRERSHRTC